MNKKIIVIITLVCLGGFVFLFNAIKTIKYVRNSQLNNTDLKRMEIHDRIINVAISRKLEIKVKGSNDWLNIGGSRLILCENQKEPKDYFLKGDSISKKVNSDTFIILRKDEKFNWVLDDK